MLMLMRRPGEIIRINNDTLIFITNICGNQVKIGIDAPKDVLIYREEIYQRILNENGEVNGNK